MENERELSTKSVNFTQRQLTIIQLWSELPTEAAVADQLGVSEHTIHTHLRRMRAKLQVRRTFEVWKYVMQIGQSQ